MDNLLNFIDNRHFLELEEKEMRKETVVHEKTIQTMLFAFPGAGLGNKLFEVISLLGIAETLQRSPVINATNPDYVSTLSKNIQPIFPKLVEQFQLKIIPFTAIAHEHTNWGACCKFDNPAKFINRSEQHMMLDGHYFQSYKYFHHMRPKIREWLAPSKLTAVRAEILLPAKFRNDLIICTHVRRGDFQYDGVHQPSDATFTRAATDFLVEFYQKSSPKVTVVVLGNDIEFAHTVFEDRTDNYKFLQETNGTRYNYTLPTVSPLYTAILTPTLTPEIDLGFSRLFCDVTLITAPSSTFGWWLSYLSKSKSTTYYRDITESKDGTSIIFSSVMIFLSLLIILLNWRLSRRVLARKKHPTVRKLRKMLIKGRSAVKTGILTPIETVILALEAGMTLEDVRLEYVNANGTREEILESVFGKLADNKFFARLISNSRFMETGYANEKIFLDLWKSESYRELVLTTQRPECPTQTFQPSALVDPLISQSKNPPSTTEIDTKATNTTSQAPPPPADPKPKTQRKSIIDKTAAALLHEGKPLLCSGGADDAI
ncbi:hypothetical protein GCK72_003435 [Caenorhabditis remanei]|uniref:Uncharacterized protein n=1 Tax=Caenorhabditis remanei TaxID=31234 RepID=A0A6A5HUG7_CAERE|nr:hypothetical protein GCK72_003435 [Caenorhabditis remanei]KAF1771608.1 hypothetical protein GCK72_003435 [Caenorhabditis remanei]